MFRPAKKAYLVLLIQVYKTACMKPQQWPPRNTPVLQSLATEYYDSIRRYVPHCLILVRRFLRPGPSRSIHFEDHVTRNSLAAHAE